MWISKNDALRTVARPCKMQHASEKRKTGLASTGHDLCRQTFPDPFRWLRLSPPLPGLQIRISVNLNFELHRTSELHFFLKLRTSPSFRTFSSNFQKMLHFGKIPKNLAKIWPKFSKNSANVGKFCKILQKNSKIFNNF